MIPVLMLEAIGPLVEGRAFHGTAAYDTPRPFVTIQQIGGEAVSFVDNARPSKINALVQVNCWGDSREQVYLLMLAIEDALRASEAMVARPSGAMMDRDEPEQGMFGEQQDFSCWCDRPAPT
ncbi:tail completion protein gp17 [Azohydromonas aeria]|uniref:tail completion protein gp17 n=1 Tax=Azohydromonas aeria TaxID=2590212 RepID=UPI0012F8D9D9|nr:DUF3168 domain-containing protein [Azohydromonas aeria]